MQQHMPSALKLFAYTCVSIYVMCTDDGYFFIAECFMDKKVKMKSSLCEKDYPMKNFHQGKKTILLCKGMHVTLENKNVTVS